MSEEYDLNKALQELIDNYVPPGEKYIFEIQKDRYNLVVRTYVEMVGIAEAYLILAKMFAIVLVLSTWLYLLVN